MKERLRSIRYGLGDLGHAIVAPFRKLSVVGRRRLVALLVLAAAIVLIVTVAVPALPCSFPGGETCAPEDEASALVPADVSVYLHANLDTDTEEYADFVALTEKLPLFSGQLKGDISNLFETLGDEPSFDFDEDVQPWFGGEVAVALFGPSTAPEFVRLIEVTDTKGADEFADSLDSESLVAEQTGGFLVIGTEEGVAAIADVTEDDSLASDETANSVRDELPEHRVVDAWLSSDGVRQMVDPPNGFSELSPLLAPGASDGAAASLGTTESGDGFELAVRSSLDPKRAKSAPGFFAAFPGFEPGLPEKLPTGSLAYLGFADPGKTVSELISQATEEVPGIAEGFEDLTDNLREEAGVDLGADLIGALGDEAAVTLDATSSAGSSSSAGQPFPYLTFVSDNVDEANLREALAALQAPLGDVSSEQQIGGVDTRTLQVSPTVSVTYAIVDGVAIAATSPEAISALAGVDEDGLQEVERYAAATEDFPDEVSLIGYVNLEDLVALGEELGLAEDPVYATFAGEFRRLDALGFNVSSAEDFLNTDVRLLLGEGPSVDDAPSAIPAPPED